MGLGFGTRAGVQARLASPARLHARRAAFYLAFKKARPKFIHGLVGGVCSLGLGHKAEFVRCSDERNLPGAPCEQSEIGRPQVLPAREAWFCIGRYMPSRNIFIMYLMSKGANFSFWVNFSLIILFIFLKSPFSLGRFLFFEKFLLFCMKILTRRNI